METILLQAAGALAFLVGTLFLGSRVRRGATKEQAERLSRVSHALFWGGLVAPGLVAIVYPGVTKLDTVVGLPPLPSHPVVRVAGWLAFAMGAYLLVASMRALKAVGSGLAAFKLTRRVVEVDLYQHARNPMSLGFYLYCLGAGVVTGSSYLLLGTVFVITPVHLFNLVYFEEHELRARHGEPYEAYRKRVPLLFPKVS